MRFINPPVSLQPRSELAAVDPTKSLSRGRLVPKEAVCRLSSGRYGRVANLKISNKRANYHHNLERMSDREGGKDILRCKRHRIWGSRLAVW